MMNSSGTVIGKGICIRGEVTGEEDFFLDGVLEGNITLTGKRLTVGANGVIHADIVAGDLVVFGRVEGSPWPSRQPSQRKPPSMSSSTAKQSKRLEPTGIRL
jgi:cytoskeletal protein CcmA (bactofilin family)